MTSALARSTQPDHSSSIVIVVLHKELHYPTSICAIAWMIPRAVSHPHHVLTLEAVALVQGRPVEDQLHDFLNSWCYW